MKFLIIHNTLNPVGGLTINVLTYSKFLLRKGHKLVFIISDHSFRKNELGESRANVSCYTVEDLFNNSYRSLVNLAKVKLKARLLDEIILAENPDVVFLHTFISYHAIRKLAQRIPVVQFIHAPWFYCLSGMRYSKTEEKICFIKPTMKCLWRGKRFGCLYYIDRTKMSIESVVRRIKDIYLNRMILSKTVHAIAANSRFCKRELIQFLNDATTVRRIHVVYPPITVPSQDMVIFKEPDEVKRILFVGRFTFMKGGDDFISALKLLSIKYQATLVGDGPERDRLERLVCKEGLKSQVKFTGWMHYESLPSLYESHDLLVVPSRWPEPFGSVGPQTAAYRKPAVAYDVGAVSEWLLDGKTGYLANPGETKDLARKMELCLSNAEKLIEMGKAAREFAKASFSTDAHYKSLLKLVETAKGNFRDKN